MKNQTLKTIVVYILAVLGVVLTVFGAFLVLGMFAFGTSGVAGGKDTAVLMTVLIVLCLGGGIGLLLWCKRAKAKIRINSLHHFDPTHPLVPLIANGIILHKDEACYLAEPVKAAHPKEITTGYVGRSAGISVRVMKGVTVRSGGSRGTPVKQTVLQQENGMLYVTNQRVVLAAPRFGFDKKITSLTSVTPYQDGLEIQSGSTTFTVLMKEPFYAFEIIDFIANSSN